MRYKLCAKYRTVPIPYGKYEQDPEKVPLNRGIYNFKYQNIRQAKKAL
jgi:hypothetical protein